MSIAVTFRQRFGQTLNNIAHVVSQPFYQTSSGAIHAICMPIIPGKEGNCNSSLLERCKRVFQFSIFLLTVPTALVGAGLNVIASYIKYKDYVYIKGNADEKNVEVPFKLMTYNGCLLPGGLSLRLGGLRLPRFRIDGIAVKILNENPDILVMQEVSFASGKRLIQKLKNNYAHFFTKIGTNLIGNDSFFFIASKYKIKRCGFRTFPGFYEMKRGVFWMETPCFHVLHSHLQYGSGNKADRQRTAQLTVILAQMKKLQEKRDKPCFLLGDLNLGVGYQREGYEKSGLDKHFVNPYPIKYPGKLDQATTTCTNLFESRTIGSEDPKRPYEIDDYILLDKAHSQEYKLDIHQCEYNWKNRKTALSDHKSVVLTVQL